MLTDNDYRTSVSSPLIFYTVKHASLMHKLAQLAIPDSVYNWIVDFFRDHAHCTKYAGVASICSRHLLRQCHRGIGARTSLSYRYCGRLARKKEYSSLQMILTWWSRPLTPERAKRR